MRLLYVIRFTDGSYYTKDGVRDPDFQKARIFLRRSDAKQAVQCWPRYRDSWKHTIEACELHAPLDPPNRPFVVDAETFDRISQLMDDPPEANEKLRELLSETPIWDDDRRQ